MPFGCVGRRRRSSRHWLASHWEGFKGPDQQARIKNTGVPMETLKEVGALITALPEGFAPHRQVKKVYDARRKMVETGEGVDWGMAEALAFGTLVAEGNHVRLSGQDVERGTFSHRHAVVHGQKSRTLTLNPNPNPSPYPYHYPYPYPYPYP